MEEGLIPKRNALVDELEDLTITIEQRQDEIETELTTEVSDEEFHDIPNDPDELVLDLTREERSESWAQEVEMDEDERNKSIALQRGKRTAKPVVKWQAGLMAMHALKQNDPQSYNEAIKSRNCHEWTEAMDNEMRSQHENQSWKLVVRPQNRRVLKNRWVYKMKINPDGSLDKFKARLVVKGFNQIEGIDYKETFAPVCRYESIRILLSLAATQGLEIMKFDISTAFLNSTLQEDIFMEQPEGYVAGENLVCKLLKGVYGLKQCPRGWFETLKVQLEKMDFHSLQSDPCIYFKENEAGPIYLCMYVDDGLIMGRIAAQLKEELFTLEKRFKLKIQPLNSFLGIEIIRSKSGIFLHQKKYIEDLLQSYGMKECKSIETLMQPGLQLIGSKPPNTNYEFQEIIGSLLFLARCTRPDITYAVHYLSRFFASYDTVHWQAAKKILQYLQGTKELGILYPSAEKGDLGLIGFVDADYGSDKMSRKSTTGCLIHFNGAPVIWLSKRQTCIALSSTESEYIALAQAGKKAVWLERLYSELNLPYIKEGPICVKTDSQSAMKLAKNLEYHDKTKHIDIRHHYIRWLVATNQVELDHIPDTVQPADILTKSVGKDTFVKKRAIMGMQHPPATPTKRKALSSVIVDPKRPNMFWTLTLLLLSFPLMGFAQDVHRTGSAVLWRKSNDPVVVGFHAIKMTIKLISPCSLLPMSPLHNVTRHMRIFF